MAKLKDLKVTIGLSKSGLSKLNSDLRSTRANFNRNFGEIGKMATQLGKNLTMSLTAPLVGMAAVSLNAFDKQRKAIAQVEAGLKSTGAAVGFTSEQLQKMASDLQSKTLFGDEVILKDATAQLLTFTNIAGDQFAQAQESALNLATRLDGDLKSASIMLGKALNDPVKNLSAMSRAGIQFSEDQKEVINALVESGNMAEAQTIILKELEKQYGGSAEAAAAAGMGPFTQLKNTLGDVSEQFGALINDMIKPLIPKIKALADRFANLSDGQKKLIIVLGGIAAMAGPVMLLVGALINAAGAMASLNVVMLANPYVLAAAAVIALTVAIVSYASETKSAREETDDLIASLEHLDKQEKQASLTKAIDANKKLQEEIRKEIENTKESIAEQERTLAQGGVYFGRSVQSKTKDLRALEAQLKDVQAAHGDLMIEEYETRVHQGKPTRVVTGPTARDKGKDRAQRKKEFEERFNESARLTEAEQALQEATFQNVVTTQDLTEASEGLRRAYGEMSGEIEEIPFDEFEEAVSKTKAKVSIWSLNRCWKTS